MASECEGGEADDEELTINAVSSFSKVAMHSMDITAALSTLNIKKGMLSEKFRH